MTLVREPIPVNVGREAMPVCFRDRNIRGKNDFRSQHQTVALIPLGATNILVHVDRPVPAS